MSAKASLKPSEIRCRPPVRIRLQGPSQTSSFTPVVPDRSTSSDSHTRYTSRQEAHTTQP